MMSTSSPTISSSSGDCSHLNDETLSALNLGDDQRIAKIYALKRAWIPYDLVKTVFTSAEELLARPMDPRLPCILLYGDPDSGKTSALHAYQRRHPIDPNTAGEHKIAPVILAEVNGPNIGALHASILDCLGAKYLPGDRVDKLRYQVITILRRVGTRQILLDELNTAIGGPEHRQRAFMIELKNLLNVLELTAFATGTKDARSALAVDPQMESRFRMVELPHWRKGEDWRRLLKSFERRIPLRLPSFLYRPSFADRLQEMTEGLLGEVAELLMQAAVLAIKTKKEKIDTEILERLHWLPAAVRRAKGRGAV